MNDVLEASIKKYLGEPPYDDMSNVCYMDGYLLQSLYAKYGEDTVNAAIEELTN